jgi:L-amino acid ligase C-terminal domain 2
MGGATLPPLPARAIRAMAVRFAEVPPGEVVGLTSLDEIKALPGVVTWATAVGIGDTVGEPHSSWDRVGMAMTCAPTPGEAMRLAQDAVERLAIKVTPS